MDHLPPDLHRLIAEDKKLVDELDILFYALQIQPIEGLEVHGVVAPVGAA
jgi:hypothetical protein